MIYRGASTDRLVEVNTSKHLMLNLTRDTQGYTGTFDIVVKFKSIRTIAVIVVVGG